MSAENTMIWHLTTEGWLICAWVVVSVLPFAVSGFARSRYFYRALQSQAYPASTLRRVYPLSFATALAWLFSLAWLVLMAIHFYRRTTIIPELVTYLCYAVYLAIGTRKIVDFLVDWRRRDPSQPRLDGGSSGTPVRRISGEKLS